MKSKAVTVIYGYEALASFLGVSRMSVHRWNKLVPVPWSCEPGWTRNRRITPQDATDWMHSLRLERQRLHMRTFYHPMPL